MRPIRSSAAGSPAGCADSCSSAGPLLRWSRSWRCSLSSSSPGWRWIRTRCSCSPRTTTSVGRSPRRRSCSAVRRRWSGSSCSIEPSRKERSPQRERRRPTSKRFPACARCSRWWIWPISCPPSNSRERCRASSRRRSVTWCRTTDCAFSCSPARSVRRSYGAGSTSWTSARKSRS